MSGIDELGPTAAAGAHDALEAQIAALLLERAKARGVALVGPGGLLTEVVKHVLQAATEAETAGHSSCGKGRDQVDEAVGVGYRFGTLLRHHRLARRLTQEELADRAELSSRTIRNLESGRTSSPYRGSVDRLADALGLRQRVRAEFAAASKRRLAPESEPAGETSSEQRTAAAQSTETQQPPSAAERRV